jgi:uncharacterized protein (DUF433 family)/DNA-binding transcriptional MerR regulator
MFPVPLTSVLSGASIRQLAYWRKQVPVFGPLLTPEGRRGRAFLYSIADVVALRSIVYLREEKSLPKIRRAVDALRVIEADDWTHLANYSLRRTQSTIYVVRPDGSAIDLEAHPGHALVDETETCDAVPMRLILAPFTSRTGREVPDFATPRPNISIRRSVLGGYPVLQGTRIPYDAVASLLTDGVSEKAVLKLYPSAPIESLQPAREFADLVLAA